MKVLRSTLVVLWLCLCAIAQGPRRTAHAPGSAADTRVYQSSAFGFHYRIPYGWVDRTKEMQEGNGAATGEVMLAVFERPPQAAGDTINSAVVIGAEKAAAGLKKPEEYLGTLTEIATAQGFKSEEDPSEIEIDTQRMVRADFSKAVNEKLTMHQSTLVLLRKGEIVTFTFIAENAEAIDNLIEGLSFSSGRGKAK